jgi:hypothetical protein
MFGRKVASFGKRMMKNTTPNMAIKKGRIPR